MSEEKPSNTWRNTKIILVLLWTMACTILWVLWTGSVSIQTQGEPGAGAAVLITTGCMGGTWCSGMAVLAMVAVIFRR